MSKFRVSEITALSDQAIDWVIRLNSGKATEEDHDGAKAWQSRSPSHRKAFAEAELLWQDMGRVMQEAGPSGNLGQVPVVAHNRYRGRRWAGTAAGLLLLASLLQFSAFGERWFSDYYTAVGEQKAVVLADGSRVALNTDTAFSVAFDETGRRIILHRGQAVFTVVNDPFRPFEVATETAVVRALGTVFEVLEDRQGTRVTVEEHAVGVKGLQEEDSAEAKRINAGQQARYSPEHGLEAPVAIDPKQFSAWRRGKLIFKNQPLAAVIAELDRYYPGRMVIVNGRLETLHVTGIFPVNDPAAALDMIADILPIKLMRISPWLTLLRG